MSMGAGFQESEGPTGIYTLQELLHLAEKGDSNAQYLLGCAFEDGDLVEQDYSQALIWHNVAANSGVLESKFSIGRILHAGLAGNADPTEAAEIYAQAAAQGHVPSKVNLAIMLINGDGVQQDYERAEDLFTEAAEVGDSDAMNNLGCMYAQGIGVAKNEERALLLFEKAAELGNVKAQLSAGLIYREGIGVAPNSTKAAYWLNESAIQGEDEAQVHLADMLMTGEGIESNIDEAFRWLKMAADQGNAYAIEKLAFLKAMQDDSEESNILASLLEKRGMVTTNDDGTRWLPILVEEFLWSGKSRVVIGGFMGEKLEIHCDTNQISEVNGLVLRGFYEIQKSRGIADSDPDRVILIPGDKVVVEWRTQMNPDAPYGGIWRLTYCALPDGHQTGYIGDLADYYYGDNNSTVDAVKQAKIKLVNQLDMDSEIKSYYLNQIAEDFNCQISI